ncbi:hypothetical protein Y1Q_0022232 [Alligator mississippiensis]|uniref:Uncharacterized protein n=1 Tax=Alligator mississippiensis TaxID=8496 RepID=A0A151NZS1_ALLMI|nr:hypothetical protein Y1Q_0022232 [Alligator mississippiensis]
MMMITTVQMCLSEKNQAQNGESVLLLTKPLPNLLDGEAQQLQKDIEGLILPVMQGGKQPSSRHPHHQDKVQLGSFEAFTEAI